MKPKNSLEIIKEFLTREEISLDITYYLKKYLVDEEKTFELPEDIIIKIIADAYDLNKDIVKKITDFLVKDYKFYFGRIQKEQLKKYVDYGFNEDLKILINLVYQDIPSNLDLSNEIKKLISNNNFKIDYSEFINNLKNAIVEKKEDRIADYLLFLYSRLININERRFLSLNNIFQFNKNQLKKELSKEDYEELQNFCNKEDKIKNRDAVSKFNENYIQILEKNGNNNGKSGLIFLNIDQELFNKFNDEKSFFSYILNTLEHAYSKLQNHKTLAIRVRNIISNGINIKWRLYAYLTIFAEKFKKIEENRAYYKPTEICVDILEHKYSLKLNESEIKILNNYYSKNLSSDYLSSCSKFSNPEIINTIGIFKKINHGFSFIDCFVLKTKSPMNNSEELNFLKNENEILLIFTKHEIDDRKIPCPICAGLNISGNSYPEVGIKSWECKNPLCSERSKTNRGKRYSERTILMQDATFDFSKSNVIPKNLIKVWRKDLVETWNLESLYTMLIKYFSFVHDSIECVNIEDRALFVKICSEQDRSAKFTLFNEFASIEKDIFNNFVNSKFVDLFIYEKKMSDVSNKNYNINSDEVLIINSDSNKVLESIGQERIHSMVTSPPYYNAREYSQWQNLFNYLNDMYQINLRSYNSLVDGGIFFYNIGDIFDNENTIVKSKMGEKRIALGAYTI